MSSVSSKILSMAGFGLVGLVPAMAGTWLWTRHGAAEEQAKARLEAEAAESVSHIAAGNLRSVLVFQESQREAEIKTATGFLAERQKTEAAKSTGESGRLATEAKAAAEAEEELKTLTAKAPSESAGSDAIKEEARTAAKLSGAAWPELKKTAQELQAKLSSPVQKKDVAALESEVKAFEAKLTPLPDPKDWEQNSKTLLEEWRRKATGP